MIKGGTMTTLQVILQQHKAASFGFGRCRFTLTGTRIVNFLFNYSKNHFRLHSSARPIAEAEDEEMYDTLHENICSTAGFPRRLATSYRQQMVASRMPLNMKTSAPVERDDDNIKVLEQQYGKATAGIPTTDSESKIEDTIYTPPTTIKYTGDAVIPISSILDIVKPQDDTPQGVWPVFRLMDENGEFRDPAWDDRKYNQETSSRNTTSVDVADSIDQKPDELAMLRDTLMKEYPFQVSEFQASGLLRSATHPFVDTGSTNTLLRAYRHIVRLREMDTILQNAQRQGRISFYMTCTGEEAIHMGSASALDNDDPIFAQYREQGLLMWRGFTLEQFTNQCFSNDRDLGKGRQMPIHYGSRALNYHTVSSPLGTQLPQAVGAAYRLKLMGKPNVAIAFFGDGCASTTDFHAALNFAATLSSPTIFFCRNNGYAISTPVTDQYAGDGVVSRAKGYGMAGIRVDGNDIFAVHAVVREAKAYALKHNAPVLIEAMTYRQGHHSTSDDSTRYRQESEVEHLIDHMDPLRRLHRFLKRFGLLNDEEAQTMKDEDRVAILNAIKEAESRPKPPLETMFEDVYKDIPPHLKKQMAQLKEHIIKFPGKYKKHP